MKLYIISLKERSDRRELLIPQLIEQNIPYEFVDGIKGNVSFRAVSQAHKKIIRLAKLRGDEMVFIAEDDVDFVHQGWQHFIDNIPDDFDIYFGGVSNGYASSDGYVHDFRGLWLYCVHSRFYDRFLSVGEMQHLDTGLSELKDTKYVLVDQFVAIHADGKSDNKGGKYRTYGHLWEGRKIFGK